MVRKRNFTAALERLVNRAKSRTRARVGHVFGVVKGLWRFDKVRYRALTKNATRGFVTLATPNVFLARKTLLRQVRAWHWQNGRTARPNSPNGAKGRITT